MPKRPKIGLIGAGNIGGELASFAARRELGDVVLLDIPDKEGVAKGKALDIAQACALDGFDANITGTSNYADLKDADVCIVTAGVPRKPGMSRDDLLSINLKIIRAVADGIRSNAPNAFVIVISNPLDAMVSEMQKVTGFPHKKVIGMAGVLDSARFQAFIAAEIGCSTKEVSARAWRPRRHDGARRFSYCTVNGIPVSQLIAKDKLEAIVERTKNGGGEIVKLMGTSAYVRRRPRGHRDGRELPQDQKRLFPARRAPRRQYGHKDLYLGVPCHRWGRRRGEDRRSRSSPTDEKAAADNSEPPTRCGRASAKSKQARASTPKP
jgi:malate dehydrogenase